MTNTQEVALNRRGCAAMIAAKREAVGVRGGSTARALGAADWLSLAATPTFALMAIVTGIFGGREDALCVTLHEASPLSGMTVMYLVMSAFHAASWLRLIAQWLPHLRQCGRGSSSGR
jgi:hypothetical protein